MKIRRIPDHAYFRDVVLVVGSDKEIQRWGRKKHPDFEWNNASGKYVRFPGRELHYIVVSTKHGKSPWQTAVLGHEILHLTFAILQGSGLELSDASEEAFTYYFQGMFARCLKHIC